jgi:hypothetical protein
MLYITGCLPDLMSLGLRSLIVGTRQRESGRGVYANESDIQSVRIR